MKVFVKSCKAVSESVSKRDLVVRIATYCFFFFSSYLLITFSILELLRKSAEHSLSEMVRLLYERLPQFPLQEIKGSVNYKVNILFY